ncbi:MAG: four helix bundle protein [Patescibacteria group bacterium]|nr:four helix bundle protein [Patescibacteria group bacterium]
MSNQNSNFKNQSLDKKSKPEVRYRAFYLSIDIIKFLDKLEYKQSVKIISDQLIRCVTSIGANIVEAKSSSSKREFLNYFQIALKSANEAKYWLFMLKELFPKEKEEIDIFLKEVDEISRIIGTSILTMKGKRNL